MLMDFPCAMLPAGGSGGGLFEQTLPKRVRAVHAPGQEVHPLLVLAE